MINLILLEFSDTLLTAIQSLIFRSSELMLLDICMICVSAKSFKKRTGGTNQSSVVRILEFVGCLVHVVNIN